MADGFGVHTEEMRAHAQKLQGVTERIGTAQDAAGQVSMNGVDAYGILCSPLLTPLLGVVELAGQSAIGAANLAVEATGTGIREMADGYDDAEKALGETFEKISGELGGK
ncbi:type VII secretion target [Parasphingorhabdus pacifica]